MKLTILKGDITKLELDAIVNAANSSLMGGGGVDGAIHRAAGPKLDDECCKIIIEKYPDGLPTGHAVITRGYNLPAKHIIHTVGPIYGYDENPARSLADCYINSLSVAEEKFCKTIAFPAISTGVYGYPVEESAEIVKDVMTHYKFKEGVIDEVVLVLWREGDFEVYNRVFDR